ncbi:MAG: hypothetical protein ACLSA6_05785 [Holdemania massiliensis]
MAMESFNKDNVAECGFLKHGMLTTRCVSAGRATGGSCILVGQIPRGGLIRIDGQVKAFATAPG